MAGRGQHPSRWRPWRRGTAAMAGHSRDRLCRRRSGGEINQPLPGGPRPGSSWSSARAVDDGDRAARGADEPGLVVADLDLPDVDGAAPVERQPFGRDLPAPDGPQMVGVDLDADHELPLQVDV